MRIKVSKESGVTKWEIWDSCATGSHYLFEIKTRLPSMRFLQTWLLLCPCEELNLL